MNKLGLIILFLAFPVNYVIKYNLGIDLDKDFALIADLSSTLMSCTGIAFIAYYFGRYEKKKVVKILYYYAIAIFNVSIVLIYLIDYLIDPIFETGKVLWGVIFAATLSLCIYLVSDKS